MKRLLLHICCAPDGTIPWQALLGEGYDVTGFFYGNNIHPLEEFGKRKEAVLSLGEYMKGEVIINPYDPEKWITLTRSLASEPEGGKRCPLCFRIQLESSAKAACAAGCHFLCTTLTISPHKDPCLINSIGEETASRYGLVWVEKIWRKNEGFKRSVHMSKDLGLYRQCYCGCVYSIRGDEQKDE